MGTWEAEPRERRLGLMLGAGGWPYGENPGERTRKRKQRSNETLRREGLFTHSAKMIVLLEPRLCPGPLLSDTGRRAAAKGPAAAPPRSSSQGSSALRGTKALQPPSMVGSGGWRTRGRGRQAMLTGQRKWPAGDHLGKKKVFQAQQQVWKSRVAVGTGRAL